MSLKHAVDELTLALHGRTAKQTLTRDTYQQWDRGFIFDAMRDQRYGQAFCNEFGITDNFLFYERDIERARERIHRHYLL